MPLSNYRPMLKRVRTENFTVLPDEAWHFGAGVNVIIGENGVGKSHLLKLLYATTRVLQKAERPLSKSRLEPELAEKLVQVFRPESLGRLVTRQRGRSSAAVKLSFVADAQELQFTFGSSASQRVSLHSAPDTSPQQEAIFFPSRELVTLAPWFIPLYDNYHVEFEETYRDTVGMLGSPAIKGARKELSRDLLVPLEDALGGTIQLDMGTGRLYLRTKSERLEMSLVAEGLRKLAMVARLIATGHLTNGGILFWDEPETNLNPKLIKSLASVIYALANTGLQIFIATHSLFLLRELKLQRVSTDTGSSSSRYFSLSIGTGGVVLEQGDDLADLATITSLDEALKQFDRLLQAPNFADEPI